MPDLAADPVDAMLIDVRANTRGFAEDVARMRQDLDGELVAGFSRAGEVLERSLLRAIRRGSLGFEDLQASASKAIDRIASQALKLGIGQIFGANNPLGGIVGTLLGGVLGLPGRATGGNVAPGRGYLVGERGPELFVPTAAGRVEPSIAPAAPRTVNVSIRLDVPRGVDRPQALQRSGRQVAAAVRKALENH